MKLESTLTGKVSRMAPDSQPGALESLDLFYVSDFLRIRTHGKSRFYTTIFFFQASYEANLRSFFPRNSGILVTSDGLVRDFPTKKGFWQASWGSSKANLRKSAILCW